MLAITYHEYGTADVLRRTELDRPEPRPGEVLVRVRAASINHADLFTLHGAPRVGRLAFGLRRPARRCSAAPPPAPSRRSARVWTT